MEKSTDSKNPSTPQIRLKPSSDQPWVYHSNRTPRRNQYGVEIPLIGNYFSIQNYFSDFYQINKSKPNFSFRQFAEHLRWPHSYLSDLIAGRKTLTVSRAVEFSKFAEMNSLEAERLILIGLKDSDNSHVQDFFARLIRITTNPMSPIEQLGGFQNVDSRKDIIHRSGINYFTVFLEGLVSWRNPPCSVDELKSHFLELGQNIFREIENLGNEFDQALQQLVEFEVVSVKENQITQYCEKLVWNLSLQAFSKLLVQVALRKESDKKNQTTNTDIFSRSAVSLFPIDRIQELRDRHNALANWARDISDKLINDPNYDHRKSVYISRDFFLVQLVPGQLSASMQSSPT